MSSTHRHCRLPAFAVTSVTLAASLAFAAPAAAQTPPSPPAATTQVANSPSVPRGDVFAGVAIWSEDGDTLPGFHLSAAINSGRHVGFVGDFVFYEDKTTAMGGVRVFSVLSKATVFGQFLFGSAPLDDIAFQPGFGVDLHLGRRAAARVAGDFKISGDDGSTYVGFRFSTGIVIRLGAQ